MNFKNYDMALITDENQRLYYLGFHSTAGYILKTQAKTIFVVDSRYFSAAKKQLEPKGVELVCSGSFDTLKEQIITNNVKNLGIDYSKTTVNEYNFFSKLNCQLVDSKNDIELDMSIKTQAELENIKIACEIAEKSFFQVLSKFQEGVSEMQIATELEYNFRLNGASKPSFDTIVAFGDNSAVPHHQTGNRKLSFGDVVLMDFGCIYNGYCSDMTRTFVFGQPTEQFKSAYDNVLKSHMTAFENITHGDSCVTADAYARHVLKEVGLDDYFTHSLGHGIGVNIHEYPGVSMKSTAVMKNGMVFSIEPGVYIDGQFGIRIEDTCVLLNGKVQSMMQDDKKLITVNNGLYKKY